MLAGLARWAMLGGMKSTSAESQRSGAALRKARHRQTDNDEPVSSFRDMLSQLATVVKNPTLSSYIAAVLGPLAEPT